MLRLLLRLWWLQQRRNFHKRDAFVACYIIFLYVVMGVSFFLSFTENGGELGGEDMPALLGAGIVVGMLIPDIIMKMVMKRDITAMDDYVKSRPVPEKIWNKFLLTTNLVSFWNYVLPVLMLPVFIYLLPVGQVIASFFLFLAFSYIDGIYITCYPEEITDELIKVIKTEEKVCNYIDMPIQHSENRILQRMGRRTSREDLVAVIKKLRKEIPDITIRTTLITGFPGESQEDHEGLMNFVEECQFDRLGVFTYSPEEDTLAATFEDQIDEEVKEERRDELMSLQQEISYEHTQQLVGKTIKVMVEGYLFEDDIYVGRSYMDAPKVDGCVFINSPEELMTGDFVYVKITQGREYDVIGEVDYEFTK